MKSQLEMYFDFTQAFISSITNIVANNQEQFQYLDRSNESHISLETESQKPHSNGLVFSQQSLPTSWNPTLILPESYQCKSIQLYSLEIFPLKLPLAFHLNETYKIEKVLPRSFFGIICQCNITHTFVFNLAERENPFFQELSGMRQSSSVTITELNSRETWELHLKPSKGVVFGYLCKPDDLNQVIQDQTDLLLRSRKLPLVLDLDDTLVRVVGNQTGRYVPEIQVPQGSFLLTSLASGQRIERRQEGGTCRKGA